MLVYIGPGGFYFHAWGVGGSSAAATRRPSSASKLYVEHAFRCLEVVHTHSSISSCILYLEVINSYRVHRVHLNANLAQVLPKVWWRWYRSLSRSEQQKL